MSSRIERITSHVNPAAAAHVETLLPHETTARGTSQNSVFGKPGSKNPSDVVIVAAARTATCKAKKGAFKDTSPDDMLKAVLEEVVKRAGVPASVVQDTVVGNVQMIGSYVTPGRAAQLRAGYPAECGFRTVNRQCSSGLQAIASIASEIAAGYIDCGVGAGVESMTNGGNPSDPSSLPPMNMGAIFEHPIAKDCLTAMGVTSENVAEKFGVSRQKQDQAAVDSHAKALRAQKEGWFKPEIVPVTVTVQDENGNEKTVVVSADEGPKPTTLETLAKLKPAFKPGGSTTAGNASQVSDGAAAVMLMRRSLAEELKVPILAVWRGYKVVGCPPDIMGIGPAVAIPALAADVGFKLEDVATYEINEAFASQFVYCGEKLGLDMNKVNPVGSGISLGHALGATGARQVTTLIYQMKRLKQQGKLGVVSMCIGGGQGACAGIEVL